MELRKHILGLVAHALETYRTIEGLELSASDRPSREEMSTALAADFGVGNSELEGWSALYYRYLAPITPAVEDLATMAHVAPRQFRRRVNSGLSQLRNALREAEAQAHTTLRRRQMSRHLPPPDYAQLFGVQPLLDRLGALLREEGPRLISIEGVGGIGKTALAQAMATQFAERGTVDGIAWISTRHELISRDGTLVPCDDPARSLDDIVARLARQLGQDHLTGLATADKLARLKTVMDRRPHLVVVDNLETLSDVERLLPALYPLAGTSRFLLTSRYSLERFPYVHVLRVPPLSYAHSVELVSGELLRGGHGDVIREESMRQVYNAVGGLPLALKLITAQMPRLPLSQILGGLRHPVKQELESLYTYIYWRTWQLLDDRARELLISMLFVSPDGESRDWIRESSMLAPDAFGTALSQLLRYSLLEITGAIEEPRYRLHRLTTTFLQSEILLDWAKPEAPACD
ncbi:MAG: AAA family ATPase [Anaerolineae bacterium]|nr:AAA family ATPase [Anaerolineae bacterium]